MNQWIKRTYLNPSAERWELGRPMRVIDELAGSVVGGEADDMSE